jgi:tRNA (guanine-N7-)-methyltransferase
MCFDRVRKIWSKSRNFGLSNLFIICGEAVTSSKHYIPAHSIEEIFINFPDPWPKNRHRKHRLMCADFVKEIERILMPSGKLTLVTDDESYRDSTLLLFRNHPHFICRHAFPYYLRELENYGTSYFEQLWRKKGKDIYYLQFCKAP